MRIRTSSCNTDTTRFSLKPLKRPLFPSSFRSYFTVQEWFEAVSVSQFNLHLIAPMVSIPLMIIAKRDPTRLTEADPWRWESEITKFIAHGFIVGEILLR